MNYVMNYKGPYYIGELKFRTIKDCEQYVRNAIGKQERKIRADNQQFQFFKQLLKNHSEYKIKRGVGIKYFQFIVNPLNKKAMHGIIKRTDGTKEDYSWLHCCRNNETKVVDRTLSSAMRNAIKEDTIEFKKNEPLICSLCNIKELPYSEYHVDHKSPPFRDIRDNFLSLSSNIPSIFGRCPTFKINVFNEADNIFEKDWNAYHLKHRTYQILCSTCNLKKH